MIRALKSPSFPPFGQFLIEFPELPKKPEDLAEVHLLTGVNGTGKTRILSLIAALLGNSEPLCRRITKDPLYFNVYRGADPSINERTSDHWHFQASREHAHWMSGNNLQRQLEKLTAFAYSGNAYVSDTTVKSIEGIPAFDRRSCLQFTRPPDQSGILLQSILNLKIKSALEYLSNARGNPTANRSDHIIGRIETVLSDITSRPFYFTVNTNTATELAVKWGNAELAFNSLPDGMRSIIGWLVHAVVMIDNQKQGKGYPTDADAIFLLDEIESHLHPAWQRKILPAFQRLFPRSQIFIATHSPFVISSLNHGWIHCLKIGSNEIVDIPKSKLAKLGDSYISVVEDILGVNEIFDTESEALLTSFRKLRDDYVAGNKDLMPKINEIAVAIGNRGPELSFIIGQELNQLSKLRHEKV